MTRRVDPRSPPNVGRRKSLMYGLVRGSADPRFLVTSDNFSRGRQIGARVLDPELAAWAEGMDVPAGERGAGVEGGKG